MWRKCIKRFDNLFKGGGGFCIKCTRKNTREKVRKTNLEKLSVENPFQSEEIKQKLKAVMFEKYGVNYSMQSLEIREKAKCTNLKKLGVEYTFQSEKVKEKMKSTNLEKRGVKNPSQSKKIREKIVQTNLKNLGVKNPSQSKKIREKIIQTNLRTLGVKNPMQNAKVKEKFKQTNLRKYGTEHPMQNEEFAERILNSFQSKEFIFPDGSKIKVQGYEPIALNHLINLGYTKEDLITSKTKVPEIWYSDLDGKIHRYYCDIFIPSENKIIEVKSTWTYKRDLHINMLKEETCKAEGYIFEFWIIDDDKIIVN